MAAVVAAVAVVAAAAVVRTALLAELTDLGRLHFLEKRRTWCCVGGGGGGGGLVGCAVVVRVLLCVVCACSASHNLSPRTIAAGLVSIGVDRLRGSAAKMQNFASGVSVVERQLLVVYCGAPQ